MIFISSQIIIIGLSDNSGEWFANVACPGEVTEDDPDNYGPDIYSIPNPILLNKLYAAAGKAKQHMPSLKSLELKLNINLGEHKFMHGFNYQQKRITIALESTTPFEFSTAVAEA